MMTCGRQRRNLIAQRGDTNTPAHQSTPFPAGYNNFMRFRLRTLLIVLAVMPPMGARAEEPTNRLMKQELDKLKGDWLLVYFRADGKDFDAAKELGAEGDKITLTFTESRYVVKVGEKVYEEGDYNIDPRALLPALDTVVTLLDGKRVERKMFGIYPVKDDIFIACISHNANKPAVFSAEANSEREIVVYRRK
jgi:uncharacterized protein (TIGR03067 family)